MDDSVFVIDSDRKVLYANNKLSKLLHKTSESICGMLIDDLFPGKGVKSLARCIDTVFGVGEINKIEFNTTIDHEVYWLETTLIPQYWHNTADNIILGISRNTTERKMAMPGCAIPIENWVRGNRRGIVVFIERSNMLAWEESKG